MPLCLRHGKCAVFVWLSATNVEQQRNDYQRSNCLSHSTLISQITATFTGPRRKSLFPKAARPAVPCATYCYHAFCVGQLAIVIHNEKFSVALSATSMSFRLVETILFDCKVRTFRSIPVAGPQSNFVILANYIWIPFIHILPKVSPVNPVVE